MRTTLLIIIVVIVAVAGTATGTWYGRGSSVESAARLQQEKDALAREKAQAAEALAAREADLERVREENETLRADLAAARELAKASASVTSVDEFATESLEVPEETQATVADEPETDRRDRRSRRGDDEGEELTPEEMEARRAEWTARREEFATRIRENVNEFFTGQLAAADDATSQERIKSMEEYSNYMMELFQQMRSAEDDEQRDALRDEMDAARETMRTLVTAQQDDMLRDVASDLGVQSGTRQDEFVTRMRETMESPFFRSPENVVGGAMSGGRRGGWGGGGFGGGWGGGGGGDGGGTPGRTPATQ